MHQIIPNLYEVLDRLLIQCSLNSLIENLLGFVVEKQLSCYEMKRALAGASETLCIAAACQ